MLVRLISGIILAISISPATINNSEVPCTQIKHGIFKYLDAQDTSAYFIVNGNNHIEYYAGSSYYIKSTVKWEKNCSYSLTMTECTLPEFPFSPKDVLHVKIEAIRGDTFFYHCKVKDVQWQARFMRIKTAPNTKYTQTVLTESTLCD